MSTIGQEDFVRMTERAIHANPFTRAAGAAMSYVRADGMLIEFSHLILSASK
ncbi:hypothetical protein [Bacillus sp. EB600]|uniref:hypothetical protein n=1 Tax=Bacillus sp. EB600 TaxID=2806345 RepID=UPI00210B2564|nr:hypothetical protein [Bacillus sp. EB600]MCQ6280323.1 hypothetical protein [Bacillus sp. EB600]